jgi:uncharacterized cysteine cluster protein YcgN (CxxCxxCC family)
MQELPFWKAKSLEALSHEEWESLCDGCGKCCLFRIQDEDSGELYTTNVICKLFDEGTCRCSNYESRSELVPTCLVLDAKLIHELNWMPVTCAYRLLAEGKDLPWWHHLVSGDANTVHQVGVSVRGKIEFEQDIDMDDLEDHVVDYFEQRWMVD